MKNTTTRLKSAIRNIADAEDMYQAKTTMNQLSHLLGLKSVTASARKKALLMLRQSMRAIILSHAEAHYIANQALYPSYVRVLLEEIEKLKKYYNTPEAEESDIMRYLELPGFDAIGEKTIKNILAFLTQTHTAFADNPELKNDGYKYLRFLSEQEVIFLYITIASSQTNLSWRESYTLILFMAADMALIDGFPIDTFYFNGIYIETVTPWNITSESSLKNMRLKLRVVFNAFNHMDSQAFTKFVNELEMNILSAVIEHYIDALGGKEALPAHINFLLECLNEVIQPLEESTDDAESTEVDSIELTAALEMLNCLCTHCDIEFLKNDWFEFRTILTSPIFGGIMRMRAHSVLAIHILGYILEHVDVSTIAKCKIRLFLALTLSPGMVLCGSHILNWIMGDK